MSTSSLENFSSVIISDPTLRDRLASAPDLNSATEIALQIAQEKGYNFSVEEVKAKLEEIYRANQSGELSDEILESVAGGKGSVNVGVNTPFGGGSIGVKW